MIAVGPGCQGVEAEQAADLGRGERDQFLAVAVGYELRRGICSQRCEWLSTGGEPPF
jgi:hypothetical protein